METAARKLAAAGAKLHDAEMPAVFDGINQSFNVISGVEAIRAMALEARDHLATIKSLDQKFTDSGCAIRSKSLRQGSASRGAMPACNLRCSTLRHLDHPKHRRRSNRRRCLGIQLRFQSRLDADARAVRHHSDVRGSKWHAGRIAGGWSGGERRPYDRIVAGRGRCSHVRWFNGALLLTCSHSCQHQDGVLAFLASDNQTVHDGGCHEDGRDLQ